MKKVVSKSTLSFLEKSREAALLAIETYNKPAVRFKSSGYIVLMNIAYTSLFHAIFCRKGLKPCYRKQNGHFKRVDGELWYWELKECLAQYYKTDTENPTRKNIEFFIPLRNIIEHKHLPQLDPKIFGECQALLFNYDKLIEKEFGEKYCLRECLSFALQMFPSSNAHIEAVKQNKDLQQAVRFISQYRSSLSTDTVQSGEYSFKAFLFQVANHQGQDTLPIQFIKWDALNDEQKKGTERIVALIKEKVVEKPIANKGLLLPKHVVEKVQLGLGNKKVNRNGKTVDLFHADVHVRCWKKYKVRPESKATKPEATDPKYCVYNSLNANYGYTQAWVDFLIAEFKDEARIQELYES